MSLQIFLHGKILGTERFLTESAEDFEGRAIWTSLLSEVLPRALLAEFGLSKMLLGSSGGGQFLVVLPEESRSRAAEFCSAASQQMRALSGGKVKLVWAMTENLGDWSDIRKRLLLELHGKIGAPSDELDAAYGAPESFASYAAEFRNGKQVAWSPEHPAAFAGQGKHQWSIGSSMDEVPLGRHAAPNDEDSGPASLEEIASRAQGHPMWAVLRGDVDDFGLRLRRAPTVEEHLQLSMMYKQFFFNELQTSCVVLPEYWRKVTLLYTGGQDFAAVGSWDALIGLAREIQRLFAIFTEANLKEYAGPEGKTISMSLVLASEPAASLSNVYVEAGEKLEAAKAAGRDSVWLFGRTLDWKQLADAAGSRETMIRMIREFRVPRQFLDELAAFYRGASEGVLTPGARRSNARVEKPWRFYRRLNAMLGSSRNKDFQRLRADLISDFTGRKASNVRLRPQGRVALEWAKLETE